MKNYGEKIIKIDNQNNLKFYDEESILNIKIPLFNYLANQEELQYKELKLLFNKINPSWEKDLITNNQILANNHHNLKRKISSGSVLKVNEIDNRVSEFAKRDYNMEFYAFENVIEDVFLILTQTFNKFQKKYKISTIQEFLQNLKNYNEKFNNSPNKKLISTANLSSFPDELNSLIYSFSTIKSLKLFIPNKTFSFESYLFFLLNLFWLFPSLLQIEVDIETPIFNPSNFDDTIVEHTYDYYIATNKDKFLLMIIMCYYIGKIDKLQNLKLKIPESYEVEIGLVIEYMKLEKLDSNFHILDFITSITSLFDLGIEFNSLDSNAFQRIICLIHKNNNLRYLKLTLFPEDENFLTELNLKRLVKTQDLKIDTNSLLSNVDERSILILDSGIDDNEVYLKSLLIKFQLNMERLYFVLSTKLFSVNELIISFNLPNVIRGNDGYIRVIHKFICNLFYLLEQNSECLQTLVINCPNLPFDPIEHNILQTFLTTLNMKKNKRLINLNLKMKINRIFSNSNLENIIPINLEYLNLGELDTESFASFVNLFKSETDNKINFSKLQTLKIAFITYQFNFITGFKNLIEFFGCKKPRALKEVEFISELHVNETQFYQILDKMNMDTVISYSFILSKKFFKNNLDDDKLKVYYTIPNTSAIYIIIKLFKERAKNLCENKIKFRLTFLKLMKFLKIKKEKRISVVFVK